MYITNDEFYITPQAVWAVLWDNGEKGYSGDEAGFGGYIVLQPNRCYKIK